MGGGGNPQQICHAQVTHTQTFLLHAASTVSIMSEEAVRFLCSKGSSLNKTCACDNISSNVDCAAGMILSNDAKTAAK